MVDRSFQQRVCLVSVDLDKVVQRRLGQKGHRGTAQRQRAQCILYQMGELLLTMVISIQFNQKHVS